MLLGQLRLETGWEGQHETGRTLINPSQKLRCVSRDSSSGTGFAQDFRHFFVSTNELVVFPEKSRRVGVLATRLAPPRPRCRGSLLTSATRRRTTTNSAGERFVRCGACFTVPAARARGGGFRVSFFEDESFFFNGARKESLSG